MKKIFKLSSIVLFLFVIVISVLIHTHVFDKIVLHTDQLIHYYTAKSYYNEKILPTEGAYLRGVGLDSLENARTPGGYFYLEYLLYFTLANGDLDKARLYYGFSIIICIFIFLFWIYKRFGIITFSIIGTLILVSPYLLMMNNQFYNPHPVFMLSFLYLPLLGEYITTKKNFIPAMLLFPILALMAQAHFSTFFSGIITLIVYLIIRFNKQTKYNIKPLLIGVFISFLTYLPYLVSEIQSGFSNTTLMLESKVDAQIVLQPPQIWSVLFFPTMEINSNYGNTIKEIFDKWLFNETILTFIFYVLSITLAVVSLFIAYRHFFKKRLVTENEENTNMIKELLFFYLLFFIVSITVYMLLNLGSARGRYFYSAYTLSYIPIIYIIEYFKTKNTKVIKLIMIYCFIYTIASPLYLYKYYNNFEGSGWNMARAPMEDILEDSDNQYFSLESDDDFLEDVFKVYIGSNKLKVNTNSNLKYIITYSDVNEEIFETMTLISSNQYYKAFRSNSTNKSN